MTTVPSNLVPTKITDLPVAPNPTSSATMVCVIGGVTYQVQFIDLQSTVSVPASRAIYTGGGLQGGGDLSEDRTHSIAAGGVTNDKLADNGVAAGTYGSGTLIPVVTVDAKGLVTSVTEAALVISGYVPDTRQIIAGDGLTGGGNLQANRTLSADFSTALPEALGPASAGSSNLLSRGDHIHPALNLASSTELTGVLPITNGGTGTNITSLTAGSIWYSDGSNPFLSTVQGSLGQVLVSGGPSAPTWGSALVISNQPANYVYAGPVSGSAATTSFRLLVNDDIPSTLTGKTISGALNNFSSIPNAALTNNSVTFNGVAVALGGSGTITAAVPNALTIGTGLTGTSYNGSAAVTVAIDSTVATLTGTQTLTNKTLANPAITGALKLTATGAGAYTPFAQTFASFVSNFNGYQLNYIQNTNNGADASVDYVAYNDASDVDSYFIDMGLASTNYTNPIFTVFPPNGGYVYTGGGTSGQASALLLGTSNAASDITLFTGGTLLANTRATIKGNTGNFLIGTTTDTGYKLNVNGTTYFGGASTFGSTVLLNANPTLPLEAATKQYVDAAASGGFVVHEPVVYATIAALPANTYNNGASGVGATLTAVVNGALSVDGTAVATSQRILVKNQVNQANNGAYTVTQAGSGVLPYILTRATDFDTVGPSEIANNAYFFVTSGPTQAGDSYVLSQTAAITVGTTALPFTLFADSLTYTGGTNITVAGQVISVSGTIAATLGGTGTSTVTTGDLLYGSAANTWSKLPLGVAYKSLIINAAGTQVEWNAIPLNQTTAVSGQLRVSNGGTGASTLTGYVKASGTSAFTASATIPNTDISGLGTMSTQAATAVAITGGSVNGTTVGATTASTGAFTTLTASSTATLNTLASSGATITGGTINGTTIGATTATTGNFTTVTATTGVFGGTF